MDIPEIEKALRLHINYIGKSSNGKYLKIMDKEASRYSGAPGIKVSKLLMTIIKKLTFLI